MPSLPAEDSSSINKSQGAGNDGDVDFDGALVIPDMDFAGFGGEYLDWDESGIVFTDFLDYQTNDPYLSPVPSSLVSQATSSMDQAVRVQQGFSSPTFSIPRAPNNAVRKLIQRPKMQTGAQRVASLILHTLKSYPLMMLRHNTLPPFIHPSLISPHVESIHMEPLTNCISLIHMIGSGVQGSRRLFWKNVRLECERLSEEVRCIEKV